MTQGISDSNANEPGDGRNQVVAVGTPLATVVGTQQGPVMVSSSYSKKLTLYYSVTPIHPSLPRSIRCSSIIKLEGNKTMFLVIGVYAGLCSCS